MTLPLVRCDDVPSTSMYMPPWWSERSVIAVMPTVGLGPVEVVEVVEAAEDAVDVDDAEDVDKTIGMNAAATTKTPPISAATTGPPFGRCLQRLVAASPSGEALCEAAGGALSGPAGGALSGPAGGALSWPGGGFWFPECGTT
jgi:hypothetical protein